MTGPDDLSDWYPVAPTSQKERPRLGETFLSTSTIRPTSRGRGVTDPCPAGLAGRASDPGGSDPAAAVRVSARRPAVDPASVPDSGSAGRDSGSDWTLRSPFFQSRRRTTVEPAFGCAETRVPRWLSPVWLNCGSDAHLMAAKNYFCTSS